MHWNITYIKIYLENSEWSHTWFLQKWISSWAVEWWWRAYRGRPGEGHWRSGSAGTRWWRSSFGGSGPESGWPVHCPPHWVQRSANTAISECTRPRQTPSSPAWFCCGGGIRYHWQNLPALTMTGCRAPWQLDQEPNKWDISIARSDWIGTVIEWSWSFVIAGLCLPVRDSELVR